MASEFSAVKQQTGVWSANQSANMCPVGGKIEKNTPSEIKIGVYNISNQNSSGECSSAVQPGNCDRTSDFQNVNKQPSALSAMDMSLLLTNALYGAAASLPFQFATNQTGAGAVPNFGLFPPFALTFPTLPISSIPRAPNAGGIHPPYPMVKPPIPRNGKPKIAKTTAHKETKTTSAARSVSQTVVVPSNDSIMQQFLSNQSHAAIAGLFPVTNKHGGQRKQSLQNGVNGELINKIPSYVACRGTKTPQSFRVKTTTSNMKTAAKPTVAVASKTCTYSTAGSSSNGSMRVAIGGQTNTTHIRPIPADIGQYSKQLSEYNHSANAHVNEPGKYQFDSSLREFPSGIQVSNSPTSNRNHVVNCTSKKVDQWYLPKHITHAKDLLPRNSEAEVADILLGLRNIVAPSVCEANSSHIQVNTQLNPDTRRRIHNSISYANSSLHRQSRNPIYSTSQTVQAMDLTKKSTSSNQHVQTVRRGVTQSSTGTSQSDERRSITSNSLSYRPTLPDSITVNKQQRRSMSTVASHDYDSSSTNNLRHFLFPSKPIETAGSGITKTSVVSHPHSCICAFDCPSHIECLHTAEYDTSDELKSQQVAAAVAGGGFNFKKVICRKFTQSIGSEPDEQHSWDIDSGDDAHNSVFDPIVTSKRSNDDVVVMNNSNINKIDQSARVYPKPIDYSETHDILPLSIKEPSILIRDGHCDVISSPHSSAAERAIDFRLKKRSSGSRQQKEGEGEAQKSLKRAKANKVSQGDNLNRLQMPKTSTARVQVQSESVHQRIPNSGQENTVKNAQSFKDLREKSKQIGNTSKDSAKCTFSNNASFESYSKSTKNNEKVKNSNISTSNLYRIRNSLGDSNDSLNTVDSESENKAEDSDASDSSCSSSDSDDCSGRERNGGRSSCSDGDSDQDLSDTEDTIGADASRTSSDENFRKCPKSSQSSPIVRSKFVLNKPKFTLASSSFSTSFQRQLTDGHPAIGGSISSTSANESLASTNKIKIRQPTFTFSSDSIAQSSRKVSSDALSAQALKTAKNETNTENVPELKCDGKEDNNSKTFKANLIRALSTTNQKIAVDGKSLRALLGEATSFYHNDRKYVLKRCLTKTKTKKGFIAGITDASAILSSPVVVTSPSLHDSNDNAHIKTTSNIVSSTIEPRVSVTAAKRDDYNMPPCKEQNASNSMVYSKEKGDTKCTGDNGHKRTMSYGTTVCDVIGRKRHKRIHEIDKLVFEGAGAGTPLPDLSLRDSDVFSNIKLRRREAAKRGIAGSNAADDKTGDSGKVKIPSKKSRENRFQKTVDAARQRAQANKTRKHSIAQKLRKYKKRSSSLTTTTALTKKSQHQASEKPRITCVRINAGIPRPRHDSSLRALEILTDSVMLVPGDPNSNENQICFDEKRLECSRKRNTNNQEPSGQIKVKKYLSTDAILANDNCGEELYTPANQYDQLRYDVGCSKPKYNGDHGDADDQAAYNHLFPVAYSKDGQEDVTKSSINCDNEWEELDIVPLSKYKENINKKISAESPEKERRYPKRSIKPKQTIEINSQTSGHDKQVKKGNNESDAASETTSTTNSCSWENDSVRSEISLASIQPSKQTAAGKLRKKNHGSGQGGRTSPLSLRVKNASIKNYQDSVLGKKCTFRLLSCFPVPAAITLGPASADLQPSYSVRKFAHSGCLMSANNDPSLTWKIGSDARETKLQLQREYWRNMTLDMFNCGTSAKVKSNDRM